MREEDDVERSGGRDREKSSGHAGDEGVRVAEKRHVGGTLRGRSARTCRTGRKTAKRGRSSEERGEMGYVGVERERGQGKGMLREGVR